MSLGANEFGDAGAAALAIMLRENTVLEELELWRNRIGPAGAASLAKILQNDGTTLRLLTLRSNRLGDEGVVALAAALHTNRALDKLSLCKNAVGDTGAEALAMAVLQPGSGLRSLDLTENNIGAAGVFTNFCLNTIRPLYCSIADGRCRVR